MKYLFRLAFLAGLGFAVYMVIEEKKKWTGLSETEARDKLNEKLSAKVPPEKLEKITDQIVDQMRLRGVLRTEAALDNGGAG